MRGDTTVRRTKDNNGGYNRVYGVCQGTKQSPDQLGGSEEERFDVRLGVGCYPRLSEFHLQKVVL